MMWNARWGMQAGVGAATQYDEAAAQQLAEQFLAGYLPGATVLEGDSFPRLLHLRFRSWQVESMLSVNAATGEVWVHTWHGPALSARRKLPHPLQ